VKTAQKPKLAVWKFASCDGCQLTLLDCEDELLQITGAVDIAYFPEATRVHMNGPYDVSLVEGSITTPDDALRIQRVRKQSRLLVAIGACATAGGIQALRNWANVHDYAEKVYAHPEWIDALSKSTPIRNHVFVDYELRGCPISKAQLLEFLSAILSGRKPNLPTYSLCEECKRMGRTCVMVGQGIPCLGPVTQAGCGSICPSFNRGCYGCFGPCDSPNTESWCQAMTKMGVSKEDQIRMLRGINGFAEPFRAQSEALER
jgi:sulfhydrogenase subunit delta